MVIHTIPHELFLEIISTLPPLLLYHLARTCRPLYALCEQRPRDDTRMIQKWGRINGWRTDQLTLAILERPYVAQYILTFDIYQDDPWNSDIDGTERSWFDNEPNENDYDLEDGLSNSCQGDFSPGGERNRRVVLRLLRKKIATSPLVPNAQRAIILNSLCRHRDDEAWIDDPN
jgi:hypothetical protein